MDDDSSPGNTRTDRICLRAIARAFASSVSAVDMESCRIVKKQNGGERPEIDIDKAVVGYLGLVDSIIEDPRLAAFENVLRGAGCSPFLVQEMLVAMVTAGFYADLPADARSNPAVVKAVNKYLRVLDRAMLGLATLLESSLRDFGAVLRETIATRGEDARYFQMRFTQGARRKGAPAHRIDRLNALFNQVLWRLERQPAEALAAQCVQIIDKMAARFAITPEVRRTLCRRLSAGQTFHQGDAIVSETLKQAMGADMLYGEDIACNRMASAVNHVPSTGNKLLGVGAALMGIGGVSTVLGLSGGGWSGLFVATGGVVSALVGFLVLITGGVAKLLTLKKP